MRRVEKKLDEIAKGMTTIQKDVAVIGERQSVDSERVSKQEEKTEDHSKRIATVENRVEELGRYSASHKKAIDDLESNQQESKPYMGLLKWFANRLAIAALGGVTVFGGQAILTKSPDSNLSNQTGIVQSDNQKQHMA